MPLSVRPSGNAPKTVLEVNHTVFISILATIFVWSSVVVNLFCLPQTCRKTWIHWNINGGPRTQEATTICSWIGVSRPVWDCQSFWRVQKTGSTITWNLHRESWVPEDPCADSLWCSKEIHGGEENPHGALENQKFHGNEMVLLLGEAFCWWIL